jgi:hypothetical protein
MPAPRAAKTAKTAKTTMKPTEHIVRTYIGANHAAIQAGDPAVTAGLLEAFNAECCYVMVAGVPYVRSWVGDFCFPQDIRIPVMRKWYCDRKGSRIIAAFDAWCEWEGRSTAPPLRTKPTKAEQYQASLNIRNARWKETKRFAAIEALDDLDERDRLHDEWHEDCFARGPAEAQRLAEARFDRARGVVPVSPQQERVELLAENGAFYVFARTHMLWHTSFCQRKAKTIWRTEEQYAAVRAAMSKLLADHGGTIRANKGSFWEDGVAPWVAAIEVVRLYRGCPTFVPAKPRDQDRLEWHYALKLLQRLDEMSNGRREGHVSRAMSRAAIRKYGPTGGAVSA